MFMDFCAKYREPWLCLVILKDSVNFMVEKDPDNVARPTIARVP
jgi:hypothetical protein